MRTGKWLAYILIGLSFLIIASCDDGKKNDFSGVSQLIADRNKTRYEKAGKTVPTSKDTSEKKIISKESSAKSKSSSKQEELSTIFLYKEDVKILSSKSEKTLARGVAYVNKQGQIVHIKIIKN